MEEKWLTVAQAAEYSHVKRQAIFKAIKRSQLPCSMRQMKIKKKNKNGEFFIDRNSICVRQSDVDEYRKNKYLPSKRSFDGDKIYDLENLRFSVLHACKWFAEVFGEYVSPNQFYHLIKKGEIRVKRLGKLIVIEGKDLKEWWEKRTESNKVKNNFMA